MFMLAYYINEFIVFSFLGWVYESIFCTFRKHHWQNRGFLFGPVCPIYGSCVVLGDLLFRFLATRAGVNVSSTPIWQVFLVAVIGSAVMEYATSYILEKRFHAIWWDYSNLPLNLHGRISLFTSLGFGVAGALIFKYVLPVSDRLLLSVPAWLSLLLSYLFVAVIAGDYALTEASLSDLLGQIQAKQAQMDREMEERYVRLEEKGARLTEARQNVKQKLNEELHESVLHEIQVNVLQNIQRFRTEEQNRIADSMRRKIREKREQLKAKHAKQ